MVSTINLKSRKVVLPYVRAEGLAVAVEGQEDAALVVWQKAVASNLVKSPAGRTGQQ